MCDATERDGDEEDDDFEDEEGGEEGGDAVSPLAGDGREEGWGGGHVL